MKTFNFKYIHKSFFLCMIAFIILVINPFSISQAHAQSTDPCSVANGGGVSAGGAAISNTGSITTGASPAQNPCQPLGGVTAQTIQNNANNIISSPNTTSNTNPTTFTLSNPLQVNSVGALVESAAEIFSFIVIIFAVIALVWVGLQYILAQGKPERLKELSRDLLGIVIGVAIVIGARVLITIVINTLSASGTVSSGVINSANNALNNTSN